jgi:uncharacterized iron-regulated membrane protein
MRFKNLRQFTFPLHRYISLYIGVILVIVGLTGSALVFRHELDRSLTSFQFGQVVPQEQRLSPDLIISKIQAEFPAQDIKITSIDMLPDPSIPYTAKVKSPEEKQTEVFVNPYTGEILGKRQEKNRIFKWILQLHDKLLIGKPGKIIVGTAAFLFLVINITGLLLWTGWRNLAKGFSIKLDGHPKRANYDIHKVVGIVAVIFLSLTAFTGFLWSFKLDKPLISLFVSMPVEENPEKLELQTTSEKAPLSVMELLQKADAALPGAVTTRVKLPEKPKEALKVHKKFLQENWEFGHSEVSLNPYTGEILKVKNGLNLPLHERIKHIFDEVHYGTFLGLPTRILYVFVGITPLILYGTSLVMYNLRPKPKAKTSST